jgi:thymidylate kinase
VQRFSLTSLDLDALCSRAIKGVLVEVKSTGFDIALLGIDGIGKSSVSEALADVLRRQGYTVTRTSWQQSLRGDYSGRGSEALRATYGAMFRSIYSACIGPDGASADRLLPRLDEDLLGKDSQVRINDPDFEISFDVNHPGPFVAAGLMEMAARIIERDFIIKPALARGEVIIQESHGLKNAIKLGMFAKNMTIGRTETGRVLQEYFSFAHRCINEWSPPAQTILLSGDPELAYRWRKEQNGRISRGEHADIDGRPVQSTFAQFQSSIQKVLVTIAESEDWPCVYMTDRPQQENIDSAVRITLEALTKRGLIPIGVKL